VATKQPNNLNKHRAGKKGEGAAMGFPLLLSKNICIANTDGAGKRRCKIKINLHAISN